MAENATPVAGKKEGMIRRLSRSVREYKRDAILTPIFVSLEVAAECVTPLLMAGLIDYGIDAGNMRVIITNGLLLVGVSLLALLFGAMAGKRAAVASTGFARNLRQDIFYNIQQFSFANIDRFSTASLVTRLTTDVSNVQNAFQMITRMAVRSPVMLVFSLLMALSISPSLSLIFLACIPVLGIGLYLIMSRVHPLFERVFKTYDKLNRVVRENLRGIRVVKAFVREDFEEKKFDAISESIYRDFTKGEKTLAFNMPLMQTCVYACMLLISWFGARLILASGNNPAVGFTTGQLMSLISYAMQILMSLMMLSMVFVMITISRASAERVDEVLRESSTIESPRADAVRRVADGAIAFDHVFFRYGGEGARNCLTDVNLTIPSGATIGILGGTGSSKSTLVQLIPRLYDATGGRVLVGGRDVREYDITALRSAVAMVLQKNTLFSGTIRDNLRWGDENATDDEMAAACRVAQADAFIRAFPDGYDTRIEQGGANVSGGQRQRLCIARALLKKPQILILDDSTSAVDTHTDALIRQGLRESLPDTTKLIIAQRVASVMDADTILFMKGGRVEAMGAHAELMRSCEEYREIYDSQMKAGTVDLDEESAVKGGERS